MKKSREAQRLKHLLKAKSNELDKVLKANGPWSEVQRLIREIEVLNEKIANLGRRRIAPAGRGFEPWMANSHLREIQRRLLERHAPESPLACPECGEPDRGNRMNNQPWCLRCNTQLVPQNRIKEEPRIRVIKEKYPGNLTFRV